MSATSQRHPDGASEVNGTARSQDASASGPTTTGRHGRARHVRTNASLTSSIASSSVGASIDAPFPSDRLPRRTSMPTEASRIFQATGFDPFSTEPDTLFHSLTVKEVEAYERAVRSTAQGKQQELRGLVGQRYEDLLGTANTIIDMAGSSSQLSQRLHELAEGVESVSSVEQTAETSRKASRRKSFLPAQMSISGVPVTDASSLHQEAIYVLGASLRLIMDAPEYVWKSIEKGKTLQAAWAFMLARATWWDLNETGLPSDRQSALTADGGEQGIASASEAVSLLRVNVKKAYPFIEKQWHSMLPMRKQIVHRAVALLSDAEIESMAVVDQLAALMLIDGTKLDQAVHLLLSQRLTAMRRMVQRQRRSKAASHHRTTSRDADGNDIADRATHTSQTITQLVTLFARTLQHAVQIFALSAKRETASSSRQPLLLDLLTTITDPNIFTTGAPTATSPIQERASLFPHSPSTTNSDGTTTGQSAAALRALRRRSSHGLPTADAAQSVSNGATAAVDRSREDQGQGLRVSTVSIVQALPSARVLLRLLPPSLWSFVPHLDLESSEQGSSSKLLSDLSAWSTKAREVLIVGHAEANKGHTSFETLRTLLSELNEVSELALVRKSLRTALHRARRIVARKLAASDGSVEESRQEATAKVDSELQQFEETIDSILQERLLHLMEQQLQHAVKELLSETAKVVTSLQRNKEQADMPLDVLFHPIESDAAVLEGGIAANTTSSSRTFAAALQDHVCGRSEHVNRLASLYETPLATLSQELKLYQAELEADEKFADASTSIRARFDTILASSWMDIEKGLADLLDKQNSDSTAMIGVSDFRQAAVPMTTSLVMRLIAVLALPDVSNSAGSKRFRPPVKAALERFWRPEIEQRVSSILQISRASSTSDLCVSASLLCALATLSESILQLGPALAGPELAEQVRAMLEALLNLQSSKNDAAARHDAELLRALLASDAASLSKVVAKETGLHRVRLALSPLLLALGTTASGGEKVTAEMVLAHAEPVSAGGQVQPILPVSRKKVERFSMLPVR